MYINTQGIVLRQVKTANNIKMLMVFTRKYGIVNASTTFTQKNKAKSALAIRPFTLGNYEFYKNKEYYSYNSGEVIKSFYKLGEQIEKYMVASYILELVSKITIENQPNVRLFDLLVDTLTAVENRSKECETILIAFQLKALTNLGTRPNIESCVNCGKKSNARAVQKSEINEEESQSAKFGRVYFDISGGGILCEDCQSKLTNNRNLIFLPSFDIINMLYFFEKKKFDDLKKIALNPITAKELSDIIKKYYEYHLGIKGLKSEQFLYSEPGS